MSGSGMPGDQRERFFLMMGGVGLDATIVTKVNPEWKKKAGKLAYWAAGVGELFHSVGQCDVRTNGHFTQVGFALAARVRNYGGDLQIAGGASLLIRDEFEIGHLSRHQSAALRVVFYVPRRRNATRPAACPASPTVRARQHRIDRAFCSSSRVDGDHTSGRNSLRASEIVPEPRSPC